MIYKRKQYSSRPLRLPYKTLSLFNEEIGNRSITFKTGQGKS